MVRSALATVLLLGTALTRLLSQQPARNTPIVPDRMPDTYLIYSLLMPGQVFTDMDNGGPWAISASTINEDDMDPKLAPEAELQPPDDNPRAFNEAVSDYHQRRKDRMVLHRHFQLSRPYVLLAPGAVSDFRNSRVALDASSDLKSQYAPYVGITYLSEVYFNVAQNAALVYILDWCGNLCSQAEWVYLEKQNGTWVRRSGKAPPQS
jgi:hypothetical protein